MATTITHKLGIVNGMPPAPSTTGYALLALLDKRPFSAYELTKHMRRSALARLWPRTETSIYREPKVLVSRGWATATGEERGGRSRTVYTITPAGREALRGWLREPGRPLTYECEAAVKAFLGDAGDLDSLRANLRVVADHPPDLPSPAAAIEDWLAGELPFPDRIQYTAMAADLIARVHRTTTEWARHWLTLTEEWDGTSLDDTAARQAREVLEHLLEVSRLLGPDATAGP